jgi:hypothetical protein
VNERLEARGLPPLAANQGRCLLLPARNIETWLYWLTAQRMSQHLEVDEITDYKAGPPSPAPRLSNDDCRPAGEYLHTLNHTALPVGCPPMLSRALVQLREFLEAVRR